MKILISLFCKHNYEFIRNIYGDEIIELNARSVYRCSECRKIKYRNKLMVINGTTVLSIPAAPTDTE